MHVSQKVISKLTKKCQLFYYKFGNNLQTRGCNLKYNLFAENYLENCELC